MKTKKTILFFMLVFALCSLTYAQLGTTSATYNAGDIETDKNFTWYNGSQSSACPGLLTVTIPVGATILSTDVSYDMTSDANSTIARQRSHFRCVSPGGIHEATMTSGPYIYTPGTESYSRTGLDIANGVTGGGGIDFELHAGATHYVNHCSVDSVKVDNNTWTVTITYIPAGFPEQPTNPDPIEGGLYVGLDDDLSWDFGANTDNYDLYFGTDNPPTTKWVDYAVAVASGTFDPGTLIETETYYWQIVSHNTNGYTEGPVWSFTTVCGSFVTPITEDFESVTLPDLPYCWTSLVNSTSPSASVETSDYYGYNAPQCLRLYGADDVAATVIFVSPQIDVGTGSLADKMVHFYLMGFSYPNVIVGTMSDPSDDATFTPYQSFLVYDSHTEHNVYFNSYVGTDTYIAFKFDPTSSYQEAYLDDITIGDLPACIKPSDLNADNMTINSAWLNWTDLNGATSWNIEYGPVGFTPSGTPTVSGVSNPYQVTGLSSSTEYDFYVQTDCGGGDLSDWSGPESFLTPCDFYSAPFSENFDAVGYGELPVCWSNIIQTGDGWTINGVNNYNSNSPSNSYHMDNGWDMNSNLLLISPPIASLSDKRLKFYAMGNNPGYDLEIGTMSNPADPATFTQLTSVTVTTSHVEYDVWLNGYSGSDQHFVLKHGNGASYVGFYIDDISIELLPSCLPPSNLFVDNITTTSAQFNWTESGTASDWIIEIGLPGFTPGTGGYVTTATIDNPPTEHVMTGLTAATAYDVYVRTDCSAGDLSEWSGPVSFMTAFDYLTMPVVEDFESGFQYTSNDLSTTSDWTIDNTLFNNGTSSTYNAYTSDNENTLLVLGKFDFTAESIIGLTFWQIAKTENGGDHCYVEISTDGGLTFDQLPESTYTGGGIYTVPANGSPEGPCFNESSYFNWGTGYEIPDNNWWKHEAFDLSSYGGYNDVEIRFRLTSNSWTEKYGWCIDDIEINTFSDPVLAINPLSIEEDATILMPANVNLEIENTGGFAFSYTASVVYDEIDLLNENFDTGLPGDWTVINNGNNDVTWVDTTSYSGYDFNGTRFMICDGSQNWGPGSITMDDELISPVIDASAYIGGGLQLEFDQWFDANWSDGDTAKVFVYDGSDWIMIYETWMDDGLHYEGGVHKAYDVSAYANTNFQIKFHYIDGPINQGRYFAIENVRLRATMGAFNWLTVDGDVSSSGASFASDGPAIVNVEMNAAELAVGTYYADIEVTSSDPLNPTTIVPCTLNVVTGSTISGTLTYANSGMSILEGCTVDLFNDNSEVIFSTNTDASGYYEFTGLVDGDYSMGTSTTIDWGGLSMNDVQFARQYVVNQAPGNTLSGLHLEAADVDLSGGAITMNDVQFMRQVVTATPPGFAPFWLFSDPDVIVSGGNITVDIQGICAGDTDGSYTPSVSK